MVSYILPVIIVIAGILIVAARKKLNRSKLALTVFCLFFLALFIFISGTLVQNIQQVYNSSYRGGMGSPALGAGAFCAPVVYIVYPRLAWRCHHITVIGCLLLLTNLSLRQLGKRISKSLKLHRIADALNDYRKKSRENRKKVVPSPAPEAFSLLTAEAEVDHTSSAEPDLSGRQQDDDDTDIKIIDFTTERDNEIIAPTAQENEADNKNGASIPEIVVQQESLPYMIPPIALLKEPVTRKNAVTAEKIVKRNARILTDTLNSWCFRKRVQVSRGPEYPYELQPAPGVKVSRIVNLSDDIALNMAAPGVRIEAPIPGKAAVGIEVPNKNVAPVILREVLESDDFFNHPSRLAFALGKDIAGNNVIADIAMMPHLLIAGATGSGKSVCINSLITSILYKATPDEVRLIMIDPKVVELSSYNGIPHLMIPVVTDPRKAAGALNWAVQEMGTRYKMFADKGVRDIVRYNEQIQDNEKKLPQIVVIIDELADLMMVAPSEVEDAICRLAQMARAAGIHLVIATQRPSWTS